MSVGLLLTINLRGAVGGCVKHVDTQTVRIDVAPIGAKNPEYITKKIKHNDRLSSICYKKINIEDDILRFWEKSTCPSWEKPSNWKLLNPRQKVESYLNTFDEGLGISYEFIN